jgi:hypothetical protein
LFENVRKINQVIRNDEKLALAFFLVAAVVSGVYGYTLRFYILADIIYTYFLLFPIFLVFLFYSYIKNPYLKFGWTVLAIAPSAFIILAVISQDIPLLYEKVRLEWVLFGGILLWACALIIYLFKRTKQNNPYFSAIRIKTLPLKIITFIRDWIPIFIVLFSYCTLKSIIPVVNPFLFDEQFNMIDYYLFFKHSPTALIINWIPISYMGLLSFGYKSFFLIKIFAFSSIYCTLKDKRVFYRMVIAFSLTYFIGLGLYYIFPSQGPIYYQPKKFEAILTPMSETSNYQIQKDLWKNYEHVKKHTPEKFCELTKASGIRNGIAAFPSLHIAVSCVLLYFLFRYSRAIFWLCFLPFWVMVLSTIYFGWHYVVDDIAGFFLAGIVIVFVNHLTNNMVFSQDA